MLIAVLYDDFFKFLKSKKLTSFDSIPVHSSNGSLLMADMRTIDVSVAINDLMNTFSRSTVNAMMNRRMMLGKKMLVHVALVLLSGLNILVADAFSITSRPSVSLSISRHGRGAPLLAHTDNDHSVENEMDRRDAMMKLLLSTVPAVSFDGFLMVGAASRPEPASARLEAVNRPDLLPKESGLNVIQTEKMLTTGQAKRMDQLLKALERDTGFRVRLLCQNYPNTPGLAIRDYWDLSKEGQKDDKYIVLVADTFGGKSNALNFNVGDGVKFALPNVFWTRLSAKYGTIFYVRENGIDLAITNALEAISSCLRSEDGYCVDVPANAPSLKSLGLS